MKTLSQLIRFLYKLASSLNNLRAIGYLFTGKPDKFVKHQVNKQINKITKRMYMR